MESGIAPKLIFCTYGDMLAIPVVLALFDGLRTGKKYVQSEALTTSDGTRLWRGTVRFHGQPRRSHPFSAAIIRAECVNDGYLNGSLAFPADDRLRVVGDGSRCPDADGLLRLFLGEEKEAHLLEYRRRSIGGYERAAAIRLLELFVLKQPPRSPPSGPRPFPRRRGPHFVETPAMELDRLGGSFA